jgi:hypothetical protein
MAFFYCRATRVASIHNSGDDGAQVGSGRKHTEILMVQFGNESIFLSVRCHRKFIQ